MNRPMRRKDHEMTAESALALLQRCEYGILASVDGDAQPYGVPLNYASDGQDAIYFHCALDGHKLDNLRNNPRVCFTVVGDTRVVPSEFGTSYESVIAFGNAAEVDGEEKRKALRLLAAKYSPGLEEEAETIITKLFEATQVVRICVEQLTGKAKMDKTAPSA